MTCMSCKNGELAESKTTYFVDLNKCYLIIENVPCMKCTQCGEVYFKASVVERIDEIIEQIESIASKILIMDYNKAA